MLPVCRFYTSGRLNEILVILDAKRGDIGNSSQHYARLTS